MPVTLPDELIEWQTAAEIIATCGQTWSSDPPTNATKAFGSMWHREQRSAVLAVPSAIVPAEYNFLINPTHADVTQIRVGALEPRA